MSNAFQAARRCSVQAHAKLNLSLRVLARELSGYHQIETVFCLIQLADELDISLRDDHELSLDVAFDNEVPPSELGPHADNLAWRAADAFRRATSRGEGVTIRLRKRIAVGAGLGGGSSDAAAVLLALNRLHGAPLSRAGLVALAGTLGSDVPFFAAETACAVAWGRGDRIAPLPPLPSLPVLLAVPPHAVATAAAYRALAATRDDHYVAPAQLVNTTQLDWQTLATSASNDFEPVIFAALPELAALHEALRDQGALIARMTGSGSTVFGVFADASQLRAAQTSLAAQFRTVQFIATHTMGEDQFPGVDSNHH